MNITTAIEEKICTITLEGSIDALSSQELTQAVDAAAPDCEKMILDMTLVDYISSSGLRVILGFHHTMENRGGDLKLIHVNEYIRDVLNLVGFLDISPVN